MKKVYEDSEINGTKISRLIDILSEIKENFGDIPVRIPAKDHDCQNPICKIEVKTLKIYSGMSVFEKDEVFLHGIDKSDTLKALEIAYHRLLTIK